MGPWMVALAAVVATVLVGVVRRRKARRHASLREDLFEGLLPSAVTGSTGPRPPSDGWGLRWADVTNLTAGDLAGPPRRSGTSPVGARAAAEPVGAVVDSAVPGDVESSAVRSPGGRPSSNP